MVKDEGISLQFLVDRSYDPFDKAVKQGYGFDEIDIIILALDCADEFTTKACS